MAIISDPSLNSFQRIDRSIQMEAQEEEEWRKYTSGKSLGGVQGHIKSHIPANSADSEEKFDPNFRKVSSFNGEKSFKNGGGGGGGVGGGGDLGGHSGYGLRENPKKTFKAADYNFPLPQEKVCKQCGKGFQSMKALCGHMACHSEKDRSLKDDHSWTSENQKVVTTDDSVSDTESEDRRVIISSSSRSRNNNNNNNNKRYKRIIIKSSNMSMANNGSSSISEIDEQEQEEVAMCLMMLSRDSSNWGGVNSVVESSDNNSVVLETNNGGRKEEEEGGLMRNTIPNSPPDDETPPKTRRNIQSRKKILLLDDDDNDDEKQENSDSGYFLGEEEVKVESDGSVDGFQRNPYSSIYEKTKKSSKMSVVGTAAAAEETLAEIRKGFGKMRKDRDRGRGRDRYRYRDREEEEEEGGGGERNAVVTTKYDEPRKKIKNSCDNLEMMNESCNKKVRKHVGSGSLEVETPPSKNTKHKKTKYECLNCKKIFSSYQALGGHRPCHKRNNAYFDSRYDTGENCLEGCDSAIEDRKLGDSFGNRKANASSAAAAGNGNKDNISSSRVDKKMIKSRKNKGHECPFCHRIFKNGQALGGHKRSHFIGGAAEEIHNHHHHHHQHHQQTSSEFKTDYSELFDLNLPARPED